MVGSAVQPHPAPRVLLAEVKIVLYVSNRNFECDLLTIRQAHGGGRRCGQAGCTKSAKAGGFCIAHGGGKRCKTEGCTTSAVSRTCLVLLYDIRKTHADVCPGGLCVAHGGGRRCASE